MARKKQSITGLDINGRYIACAQSVPGDNLVTNVSIQLLTTASSDYWYSVEENFKELAEEAGLKGSLSVCSLPGDFAVIKVIAIDDEEEDVEDALGWELSQHIIGSIDEYVFDYEKLEDAAQKRRYLVAGYKDSSVKRLVTLLKETKITPLVIDLDLFALINVFEVNYPQQLQAPALLIYGDEEKTRLILTKKGKFFDVDMIYYQDGTIPPQRYGEALQDTVSRMLKAHAIRSIEVPVFTTGTLFSFDDYTQAVSAYFPHAELLYPFRNIQCSAGMDDESRRKYAPQLAVAVGLTLRGND
ncbi:MAG: type IV pilus biogenesis protein PilM [Chitinispirillaceae bacterium]